MGETRKCVWCGHENPPEAEVCEKCGSRLTSRVVPQEPPRTQPVKEDVPSASPREEEVPAWLFEEGREEVESEEMTEPEETEPSQEPELPEWLLAEAAPAESEKPPPAEQAAAEEEGLPEWLISEAPAAEAQGTPPAEQAAAEEEGLPEWLVAEKDEAAREPLEIPQELFEAGTPTQERAETPEEPDETARPTMSKDTDEDMGGVLLDEQEWQELIQAATRQAEAGPETEEAPEPAELPEWLRELQQAAPAESEEAEALVAEEEKAPVPELAGPLVGIPDVLPPEPRIFDMVEPVRPVLRLLLRPEEREWARRFQQMLRSEAQGEALRVPVEQPAAYGWWRLGVSLVLFLLLGLLMAWGGLKAAVPAPSPALLGFVDAVQHLPASAVALVAVDYDPAWDVEMRWPARLALTYLESRQPYYVVLSTLPYGPDLARSLFQEAGIPSDRYTVLGYLPGGRIGLALLAQAPTRAFPYRPFPPYWKRIQDAHFLLIMTENPVRARDWMEQIGPALTRQTPMTMVLSTQTAPALAPYLGHPLRGWIAGAGDAAVLSRYVTVPQTGISRAWAPTSVGGILLGLALALMAAGVGWIWQVRQQRTG